MLDPKNLKPGESQHETFFSEITEKEYIAFDYRNNAGKLFLCVAVNLESARQKLALWQMKNGE